MMNPITDLSAAQFLALQATTTVVVIGLAVFWLRLRDRTRLMTPPPLPDRLDPYELAYLRGGQNELTRVILVSLVERGYLGSSETRFAQASSPPDQADLSDVERVVHDWLVTPQAARSLFRSELPSRVGSCCLPLDERFQREQLVPSDADNSARSTARIVGGMLIGVLVLRRRGWGR